MSALLSNRIGVVASAMTGDIQQAPRQARLAGFSGLLLDVWSANLSIPDLSASGRRDLQKLLSAQEQSLIGLQMEIGAKGLGPGADVDYQIARLDRAMESAAGMNSPLVSVELGPLPAYRPPPKPIVAIPAQQTGPIIIPLLQPKIAVQEASTPPDSAFVSQVNAALVEVGVRADRYSVMLAFSSTLANFGALGEALEKVGCSWFGIDLDPVAAQLDEWNIDEIFSRFGRLVCHVRGRDAVVGGERRTRPAVIGSGSVDWAQLLSSLEQADYRGFITIDPRELPDRTSAAVAGAKYLRNSGLVA